MNFLQSVNNFSSILFNVEIGVIRLNSVDVKNGEL